MAKARKNNLEYEGKWEIRECATLGTHWKDVYKDDELFLREVPTDMAERFVAEPWRWSRPFVDLPKMRTLLLEIEMEVISRHIEMMNDLMADFQSTREDRNA